jgi:O-antigen ligase
MITNVKALIVVLTIAAVIFRLGKPIALLFSSEPDFARRRNVWFVLTATAFLSPNFWLFVVVAAPILGWAGRKDSNPLALYLILLHVIPPLPVDIPIVGIKALFPLDNYRLLSFCVLIPAAWRLRKKNEGRIRGLTPMDFSILAFGLVQLFHFVPPDLPGQTILQDSATNVLRRGILFFVDIYVLYFVASRTCSSRRAMIDAMSAACIASALMASVAVFESVRNWLLYLNLADGWGLGQMYGYQSRAYYFRGGFLRAQAAAGHALALGYLVTIAFGFWLYLKSHVKSAWQRNAVATLYWLGLLASQARGPMLGAIAIYFAFFVLGPRAVPRVLKAAVVVALLVGTLSLTPFGGRVVNSIPFFGESTERASLDYRQRLAERSWELIQLNPFLGDPLAKTKMEDLRQGEGIIDLVNTYAEVTLFYGSIGLLLFLAVIIVGLFKAYRASREFARRDPDFALLGITLVACLFGTLLMIGDSSLINGYEKFFYVLAGLAAAYAYIGKFPGRS